MTDTEERVLREKREAEAREAKRDVEGPPPEEEEEEEDHD